MTSFLIFEVLLQVVSMMLVDDRTVNADLSYTSVYQCPF